MSEEEFYQEPQPAKGGFVVPVAHVGGVFSLGLLFLKLVGLVDASWLWVAAPAIAGVAFIILVAVVGMVAAVALTKLIQHLNRGEGNEG